MDEHESLAGEGLAVGKSVGNGDGRLVGSFVGVKGSSPLGDRSPTSRAGLADGSTVRVSVGVCVGLLVGRLVGDLIGDAVGRSNGMHLARSTTSCRSQPVS